MTETTPPRDDLYRAMPGGVTSTDGRTLMVRLAPPDQWAEVRSAVEGHFMERFARSAYRKTMAEHLPKILLNHGKDPQLGDKPISTTDEVGEDDTSPYARGQLLDGVPEMVVDGIRKGVYGASHKFSVIREEWDPKPKGGPHNPDRLPERTITEARLYELGPVTWPVYAGASVALRSITDEMRPPLPTVPAAPSVDAAAPEPHLDPERRDEPDPPPDEAAPIAGQDPPEGGSSDSRSITVEYVTRDEKASRVTELRASLAALAVEYPGVLPADAQTRWDNETAEMDAHERDIAAWDERLARVERFAQDPKKVERGSYEPVASIVRKSETDIYDIATIMRSAGSPEQRDQLLRDNAMRASEQMRVQGPRFDQDASRARLADLIDFKDSADKEIALRILTTNSPQYRAAFNRYVSSGGNERGSALAVGVDGTGGYAVPVSFDPTMVAIGAWTSINPYRQACRVETISGTDTWQALTATAVTAAYALEAAAATEQGPTFARPEFIVKRAHAFVTSSWEMAADRPSLPGDLGQLFGEAKDTLEENQFTVGVGTTVYPQGMGLKDAYTRTDSATNDTVAVADMRAVEAALPIRHRMNAAWFLSRAAIRAIQAFETTGGQLFNATNYAAVGNPQSRPGGNTGLTLLGYPIYETPSMPWTPTTDDTTWGVLCNPKTYVIVDRVGMSVRVFDQIMDGSTPGMPTGQIGFYAFWRNTARVLNADGGRQGAVQ